MLRKKERLSYLKAVPVLAALNDKELALVDRLAERLDVAAGSDLMRQGQLGHEFYVLLTGKAEVLRDGMSLAVLGPGDHVGELALLDPQPRTATVTVTEDATVLELTQREFWQLLEDVPVVARKVLQGLARRLHAHDVDALQ